MLALMGLRYFLLLSIIPAYAIALKRRRWGTMPLWLVSTAVMLTQFALSAQQSIMPEGQAHTSVFVSVGEMTKIIVIPIAVQLAVALQGWREREAGRAGAGLDCWLRGM